MPMTFARTASGRQPMALQDRRIPRTARNLLRVVDPSRPAIQWVALIHGATQGDIVCLLAHGLIEPALAARDWNATVPTPSIDDALSTVGGEQLVAFMTSQAQERLGLFRGLMFRMAVKRCSCEHELRRLAARFIALVRETQGELAARKICTALGAA